MMPQKLFCPIKVVLSAGTCSSAKNRPIRGVCVDLAVVAAMSHPAAIFFPIAKGDRAR